MQDIVDQPVRIRIDLVRLLLQHICPFVSRPAYPPHILGGSWHQCAWAESELSKIVVMWCIGHLAIEKQLLSEQLLSKWSSTRTYKHVCINGDILTNYNLL